jgi:lipopolysaccharide cholinephosphotransferase
MIDVSNIKGIERDGYFIDKRLRQLQMVELDLLKELLRVCNKHNLRVFADSGTLLGAVRHGGFIPWDDDIDVVMPRPDYDKLATVATQEFCHPYFFQNTYTDPLHVRGHAQLRNSETTAILEEEYDLDINHGVFLDIFPLDGVPDNEIQQVKDKKETRRLLSVMRQNRPFKLPVTWNPMKMFHHYTDYKAALNYLNRNNLTNKECFCLLEDILRKTSYETAPKVGSLGYGYRLFRNRNIYEDTIMIMFESIEIPIPIGYKRLLRDMYGESYMTPIKGGASHTGLIYDAERPYPVVQAELRKEHSWLKDFWKEIKKRLR